jgi:sterol 14-demethylase
MQVSPTSPARPLSPPKPATPGLTPPRLSGGVPVLGHALDFGRDLSGLLTRCQREVGEICALRAAHRDMVVLSGPEGAEAFFRAPDDQLSMAEAYKLMIPVFGKDVAYDASPERMGEQMAMLRPALQDRRMRTYAKVIAAEVRRATASWGESGMVDLVPFFAMLTSFTSTHCLLGTQFRNQMSSEFARIYADLEKGVTPLGYINPYLPLPSFRLRDRARAQLKDLIGGIVQERKRTGERGEDFLQTMIDARYADGSAMSDHEITGMILAVLFAGHHTSSVSSSWTLLELLGKPEYMRSVVDELHSLYGPGDEIDFPSLRKLDRTEWAIKEALRLHPPLFVLLRVALRDFDFKQYRMPAGTWLVTSPWVNHRIENTFKDAESFDPLRFSPERAEDKQAFSFLSFGAGRHRCLGNAFALLQIKTIMAVLLRSFAFEDVGDPVQTDWHGLVAGPKRPTRVRYRRIAAEGTV